MTDNPADQTVLITADNEKKDAETYDYVISVEHELTKVTRDDILEAISRFASLDVPHTGCIEFSVLWRRISKPQTNNLLRAILLSQQLQSHLNELGVTHGTLVIGESLDDSYSNVAQDVANMTGLKTKHQSQNHLFSLLLLVIRTIITMLKVGAILSDWFVSRLTMLFRNLDEKSVVYFPSIERINSTLPVVERFNTEPQTIITEPSWYYATQFKTKSNLDVLNPMNINYYLSLSGFVEQIRDIGTIGREILTVHSFAPDLADAVEAEFGVYLESATNGFVRSTLNNTRLIRALVLRRSLHAMFASDHVEKVVMGSLDPIGRAIVHEAAECDVQVYHIPHSIATTHPPYPGSEVIQFLSGEMDIHYYEQVVPRDQWWEWVPSGRPYLSDLEQQYGNQRNSKQTITTEQDRFRVLLATQPFSQAIREQFIETMVSLFGPNRFEVTIKPHPDENISIYEEIGLENDQIHLITDNLYDEIVDADLTVTVNSNVGLESIVIGTPVICFNPWEPFILEQTFAFADEVPVFRSESEFQTFVSKLDNSEISQLSDQQRSFADRSYRIEPDTAANIAEYIEEDSVTI